MTARRTAVATLAVVTAALLALQQVGLIWRTAYPYLPRAVQGGPYLLRQHLRRGRATPVDLPTPARAVSPRPSPADPPTPARAVSPLPSPADPPTPARAVAPRPGPAYSPTPALAVSPRPTPPGDAREWSGSVSVPAHSESAQSPATPAPVSQPGSGVPGIQLAGLDHEYQTWNNCGPATISMALSYYGVHDGQAVAARLLKPDPDDKNVSPEELATYARLRGLQGLVRVAGDIDILRALLAAGFPVVVETWFEPEPGDEMGHYRVLTGFSDATHEFTAYDSYAGPGVRLPYAELDQAWRVFNRTYLVVYDAQREPLVRAVLQGAVDEKQMYLAAEAVARQEIRLAEDAFAWFNLGSSLLGKGDDSGAAAAYDRARALGLPWRMLWYQFGPFEAYAATGRWSDVKALAEANLKNASNLEESHYWLGRALQAEGDLDAARGAWLRALELNSGFEPARAALESLD